MGVLSPSRWGQNKQQPRPSNKISLRFSSFCVRILRSPVTQSEGTNPMSPEAGSTRSKHLAIVNTQCDKEPQEAVDISIIRDIDLM